MILANAFPASFLPFHIGENPALDIQYRVDESSACIGFEKGDI
jgi:hypothetical protein